MNGNRFQKSLLWASLSAFVLLLSTVSLGQSPSQVAGSDSPEIEVRDLVASIDWGESLPEDEAKRVLADIISTVRASRASLDQIRYQIRRTEHWLESDLASAVDFEVSLAGATTRIMLLSVDQSIESGAIVKDLCITDRGVLLVTPGAPAGRWFDSRSVSSSEQQIEVQNILNLLAGSDVLRTYFGRVADGRWLDEYIESHASYGTYPSIHQSDEYLKLEYRRNQPGFARIVLKRMQGHFVVIQWDSLTPAGAVGTRQRNLLQEHPSSAVVSLFDDGSCLFTRYAVGTISKHSFPDIRPDDVIVRRHVTFNLIRPLDPDHDLMSEALSGLPETFRFTGPGPTSPDTVFQLVPDRSDLVILEAHGPSYEAIKAASIAGVQSIGSGSRNGIGITFIVMGLLIAVTGIIWILKNHRKVVSS